jgi:hypothetical protein
MGMAAAHREGCALLMVMVMVLVLAPAMAPAMIIVLVPAMAMAPALVRWLRVGVRYVTMRCVVRTAARCCSVGCHGLHCNAEFRCVVRRGGPGLLLTAAADGDDAI